jgi:hypothetical protein
MECRFWSRVDLRIRETEGCSLSELALGDNCRTGQGHSPDSILFREIAYVSGQHFVVDSSKTPSRLAHLIQTPDLNLYAIHLVREPKGQISSVMDSIGLLKAIANYEIVHMQILRLLKSVPHCIVRYEDLVCDPRGTLTKIMSPLGLSFDQRQMAWADQEKHSVAGNHLRWKTSSELILDERWKSRLSRWQRLVIEGGTIASRSLISNH